MLALQHKLHDTQSQGVIDMECVITHLYCCQVKAQPVNSAAPVQQALFLLLEGPTRNIS